MQSFMACIWYSVANQKMQKTRQVGSSARNGLKTCGTAGKTTGKTPAAKAQTAALPNQSASKSAPRNSAASVSSAVVDEAHNSA